MAFDRKQFLDNLAETRRKREAGMLPALQAAQAVAPVMEKLMTGDPNWDRYLQHVQELRNQAVAAKARAEAKQRDPLIWDHETMSRLKSDIISAEAYIEAFTLCMELPKALIENAEIAKQTIARLEAGNDQTTGKTDP